MVRWSQGRTCRQPVLKQLNYGMKIIRRRLLLTRVAWVVLWGLAPHETLSAAPRWVTAYDCADTPNTWMAFRKDVRLTSRPRSLRLKIAADTKYWLWVNGKQVVFEGGLKRGPDPTSGYYDEIDIAPHLRKGTNRLAVLVDYMGRDGFSHKSSGRGGLVVDGENDEFDTDARWMGRVHSAYGTMDGPRPNFRLAESNIRFDANRDMAGWQTSDDLEALRFKPAKELGGWNDAPWGRLEARPIPMWKDYGVKAVAFRRLQGTQTDTIVARLPYNMQFTPVIRVVDETGNRSVRMFTDHLRVGGQECVQAEYITRRGDQSYESPGWMNGDMLLLTVPCGMRVAELAYRETGYAAERAGSFSCDDAFFNRFWDKALRTLYVNMRDTYFDCPDRERAQWWGDICILMGESFYTYEPSIALLTRKAIRELCNWQKADGVLYSPIPGNYTDELPAQMLAAIGVYGFYTYYMYTGDLETLREAYPHAKKYLALWSQEPSGMTAERHGGWDWGDWGAHNDMRLNYAAWHYIALDGMARAANVLGMPHDAEEYGAAMRRLKGAFDRCWDGNAYRHPDYKGMTDDRVQALAVVAGIADEDKYPAILNTLRTVRHASPYMEKYVMEALFKMGQGAVGMERVRERYATMVQDTAHTTLYELWSIGGSSVNHAWSGGPLTVIAQCLMGVRPVEPGFKTFAIAPQYVFFKRASHSFAIPQGMVATAYHIDNEGTLTMDLTIPRHTRALVDIPATDRERIRVDGKKMAKGQVVAVGPSSSTCRLKPGTHRIVVEGYRQATR